MKTNAAPIKDMVYVVNPSNGYQFSETSLSHNAPNVLKSGRHYKINCNTTSENHNHQVPLFLISNYWSNNKTDNANQCIIYKNPDCSIKFHIFYGRFTSQGYIKVHNDGDWLFDSSNSTIKIEYTPGKNTLLNMSEINIDENSSDISLIGEDINVETLLEHQE